MKPHNQAVRGAKAWERIEAAVGLRAKAAGVKVQGLDVTHRDPGLQQLFRMEALADYLEGNAPDPEPAKPAKVKAEAPEPVEVEPAATLEPAPDAKPAKDAAKPAKGEGTP